MLLFRYHSIAEGKWHTGISNTSSVNKLLVKGFNAILTKAYARTHTHTRAHTHTHAHTHTRTQALAHAWPRPRPRCGAVAPSHCHAVACHAVACAVTIAVARARARMGTGTSAGAGAGAGAGAFPPTCCTMRLPRLAPPCIRFAGGAGASAIGRFAAAAAIAAPRPLGMGREGRDG